jgi:GTP cyclohydrolase I
MEQVGEELADKIVDQTGNRITQTLYEQMCRNYSITPAESTEQTADDTTVETLAASGADE